MTFVSVGHRPARRHPPGPIIRLVQTGAAIAARLGEVRRRFHHAALAQDFVDVPDKLRRDVGLQPREERPESGGRCAELCRGGRTPPRGGSS
jgi:hypothetical protein